MQILFQRFILIYAKLFLQSLQITLGHLAVKRQKIPGYHNPYAIMFLFRGAKLVFVFFSLGCFIAFHLKRIYTAESTASLLSITSQMLRGLQNIRFRVFFIAK